MSKRPKHPSDQNETEHMSETKLYFAYGSNMNLRQMAHRCPNAIPIQIATLDDYALAFRGNGVATIVPREGAHVTGLVWRITPACEKALDRYEGWPSFYGKSQIMARFRGGAPVDVMVYIMNPKIRDAAYPPQAYLAGIREAYQTLGLSEKPLNAVLAQTKASIKQRERRTSKRDSEHERDI